MDYGHELAFGTFITPTAQQPQQAVTLAQLTERAGLDLATFQDHPYQPAFLDTWTLLSFAAARTERITLAPNVANLPLRPPAVLARAAASLDLLSDGRFSLGLGAGGFWDPIAAMGGPRRTPGEAVEALEEAIDVIRQTWDTGTRGGVRVEGRHYQVMGAKRGPEPAHRIPIWVGAYKPRMLRLVGRLADGSLPSMGYLLGPEQLGEMNDVIDEAAVQAGRDPRDIRRLLNIGPGDAAPELLAELALAHGVSTFILGSDDPGTIEAFGAEVAPAVREIVAGERTGTTEGRPATPVDVTSSTARADEAAGLPSDLGVVPTPDTGERLSDRMPWDESTRPRAVVPADPAYSRQGRMVSQHLVDVHDALRAELAKLRDIVDQVVRGALGIGEARSSINAMTLRQNDWTLGTYCQSYCRFVTGHHSLEDTGIFPHLRMSDAGLAPVLDRLQEEHVAIHDVIEAVDRALVEMVANPGDHTALVAAVDLMTDTMLSHLAYEERELVEPLARHGMYAGQL